MVWREEAEQLAKNLERWSKRMVQYVEWDAREKGGLQAVMEAVLYPSVAHIQVFSECTFAELYLYIAIADSRKPLVKQNRILGQSCTILIYLRDSIHLFSAMLLIISPYCS